MLLDLVPDFILSLGVYTNAARDGSKSGFSGEILQEMMNGIWEVPQRKIAVRKSQYFRSASSTVLLRNYSSCRRGTSADTVEGTV